MGLSKGDRICIFAYNCLEWMEIYAATAMAGLVAVPINFRLVGPEIEYIVENCEARAFIVQNELLDRSKQCARIFRFRPIISSSSAEAASLPDISPTRS